MTAVDWSEAERPGAIADNRSMNRPFSGRFL
jgi:hypothetical protein